MADARCDRFKLRCLDRSRWRPCTKLKPGACRGQVGLLRAIDRGSALHWIPWPGPLPLDMGLRGYARRRIAEAPHPCAS